MLDFTDNDCAKNANQSRKIIYGSLVLTATSNNFSRVSIMSKQLEFNFLESNHFIFDVRAAIPLSHELASQVFLSGEQEAFKILQSRRNTISTALIYTDSETIQEFHYSNFMNSIMNRYLLHRRIERWPCSPM